MLPFYSALIRPPLEFFSTRDGTAERVQIKTTQMIDGLS